MTVNFPIEHVISEKPNKDSLDPSAPVKMTFGFANLLLTLILSHNDFEIQLHDAPLAIKLRPLLHVRYKACGCTDEFTISLMCSRFSQLS